MTFSIFLKVKIRHECFLPHPFITYHLSANKTKSAVATGSDDLRKTMKILENSIWPRTS